MTSSSRTRRTILTTRKTSIFTLKSHKGVKTTNQFHFHRESSLRASKTKNDVNKNHVNDVR